MRGFGITYDTGFINQGVSTRESFDPELVKHEMRVIREELHCTAVRITGGDVDRLEVAAVHAAGAGLEVWICPFTCDLTTGQLLDLLADCAARAERLRQGGAEVVLVTGSELSLFTVGFLPGETLDERLQLFSAPPLDLSGVPGLVNDFLGRAVAVVRARFGGKVTYASLPFEGVDWAPFDFVATDGGYRSIEVADHFVAGVRALVALGKPVAITEFGSATYRGAADRGARGGMVVEWEGAHPVRLDGDYVRDEEEQAAHLLELLDIFETEGVDTAFANTFASYHLPHREGPRADLDLAGYGVVKVLDGRPWEPKAAFHALATRYARMRGQERADA